MKLIVEYGHGKDILELDPSDDIAQLDLLKIIGMIQSFKNSEDELFVAKMKLKCLKEYEKAENRFMEVFK